MAVELTAPAPPPKAKSVHTEEDESMAALLLEDDGSPAPAGVDPKGIIPDGSTVMMSLPKPEGDKKDEKKDGKKD